MIIKSITIDNFKNIQHRTMEFDAGKNHIIQDNGWGKSNMIDAIMWVFTDKLKDGSSDIQSIKSKPIPNDPAPKKESKTANVKIVTDVGTFEKSYYEIWKAARGKNEKVLDSHSTRYVIDNQEYKKNTYEVELALRLKMPLQYIPILMNCTYFGTKLDVKERRAIIQELVPTVDTQEIYNANPNLAKLIPHLDKEPRADYLLNLHKKRLSVLRKDEQTLSNQVDTHKKALLHDDTLKLKGAKQYELNKVRDELSRIQSTLSQSKGADKEALEKRVYGLREEYKKWDILKKYQISSMQCHLCGGVSSVDTVLKSLIEEGKTAAQSLESIKNNRPVELSQEILDKHTVLKNRELELDNELRAIYASENASFELQELEPKLGSLSMELMATEQLCDWLVLYLEEWIKLFDIAVNEQFNGMGLSFKMIEYNLSDGIKNVCEILDNKVPYEYTNTASQIKLGIKLIDAIKEAKNLSDLPILIDNAEAIIEKNFVTNAQLIMFSAGKGN